MVNLKRTWLLLFCFGGLLNGCGPLGIAFLYKKAPLPSSQIVRNIQYSDADPVRNTLNLFCGVIPISGVGYNFMTDEEYQLGKDENLYKII